MEITLEGKKSKDRMGLVSRSHVTLASSQWQSRKRELRESCMNRQKMEPAVASRALPQWRKQRDNQNNLCFPCHGFWNVDMQQPEQAALAYAEFLKYKYPMCIAEEWLCQRHGVFIGVVASQLNTRSLPLAGSPWHPYVCYLVWVSRSPLYS